ncbi:MAG: baseplate protein [Alphaproteobacteria bacterium]|nr:MAG: baseplate protein [Alphaproteobacteria bacterium]
MTDIATLLSSLPEPRFVATDPQVITAEMVAAFEAVTGRTLYPAQVERLMLDFASYREALVRIATNEAAKQTLLAYASGVALDHLALPFGVTRLPPARATAHVRISRAPDPSARVLPLGTVVEGSGHLFATQAPVVFAAGAIVAEVEVAALVAGRAANDLAPGALNRFVANAPATNALTVTSLTVTAGGSEPEADEAFRLRIAAAPEKFSTAGPAAAYRFWAISATPAIADAQVISPTPGVVEVTVLAHDEVGDHRHPRLPTGAEIAAVAAQLSDEKRRPLTDQVIVLAPTRVPYTITAMVERAVGADATVLAAAVEAAAAAWAADRRAGLGRDLVASSLVAALSVPGSYRVTVASPADTVIGATDWADCTGITITVTGAGAA